MRKFRIILTCLFTLLLLFACVKEKYDWDECNPKIFIRFDWSTVTQPENTELVTVVITDQDQDSTQMEIPPEGQEVRIEPKVYSFTGHTTTENVTVSGTTVTVKQDADGKYLEPDYFTGGSVNQEIYYSTQNQVVVIPMRSQTRPLIIRVILQGQAMGGFSHITGVISGIAMSRDINNGFAPLDGNPLHPAYINGSVNYDMTTEDNHIYSDQKNLLGTDGTTDQILSMTAYYTSGNQNTIEVDVTNAMVGFHTENVDEPWVLEFTLNLVGELQTEIEDWQGGYQSSLQAR